MEKNNKKKSAVTKTINVPISFKILSDEKTIKGVYSNSVMIQHTKNEFMVDFLLKLGDNAHLVSRVILSPNHFNAVVDAFKMDLEKYINKFGKLDKPIPLKALTKTNEGKKPQGKNLKKK